MKSFLGISLPSRILLRALLFVIFAASPVYAQNNLSKKDSLKIVSAEVVETTKKEIERGLYLISSVKKTINSFGQTVYVHESWYETDNLKEFNKVSHTAPLVYSGYEQLHNAVKRFNAASRFVSDGYRRWQQFVFLSGNIDTLYIVTLERLDSGKEKKDTIVYPFTKAEFSGTRFVNSTVNKEKILLYPMQGKQLRVVTPYNVEAVTEEISSANHRIIHYELNIPLYDIAFMYAEKNLAKGSYPRVQNE